MVDSDRLVAGKDSRRVERIKRKYERNGGLTHCFAACLRYLAEQDGGMF